MKKLLYFLLTIMVFVACSESSSDDAGGGNSTNDQPKAPKITLDATVANFTTEGGSTTVTFTSSDVWTAETINNRADAWCSVSPTNGSAGNAKITITATSNNTGDDRTATVVVKSGTTQKTISVSQKQKDALTVTSTRFEVSADGGEIEIEVKANIDFEYTIDESAKDWVEYRTTRAMKTSTLVFAVKNNEYIEKREAKITIKNGELSEVVSIYQEGAKPTIVLSQNEYTVPSSGETITVEVKSNVDVIVEMPTDADWISENTARATSTNTYYFDIASNEEYDARKAVIKFINEDNNLSETITIIQTQKNAIVIANDIYEVNGIGGEIEIEVGHNIEFDIKIEGDWITQKQTRTLEISKLTFIVAENTTDKTREGSITFTSKDAAISQKTFVIQGTPKIPNNQIWYTSNNEKIVTPNSTDVFGANITSNTYENGKGVITFNGDITSIGKSAFNQCESLTSVTIPNSVTEIGGFAFGNCTSLTSVTIPDSITDIGEYAFIGCECLTSITIGNSVTSIGKYAFFGCESLTSMTIPNNVTSIGVCVFGQCHSLTAFLGKFASSDNRCLIVNGVLKSFAPAGLSTYTIPSNVTSIENYAFYGSKSLTSVTIPNSVISIGKYAFEGCNILTSVTIPNSITEIGEFAFSGCIGLTSVTIPNSVISIGEYAFNYCNSLTSVTIPNSVTSIGEHAFYRCKNLTSVTIGNSVTEIGICAFEHCYSLVRVYCKPTTPPKLWSYVFDDNASGRKIYVPTASVEAYKAATNWRGYADSIFADSTEN